jgi:YHS domain-containing protein
LNLPPDDSASQLAVAPRDRSQPNRAPADFASGRQAADPDLSRRPDTRPSDRSGRRSFESRGQQPPAGEAMVNYEADLPRQRDESYGGGFPLPNARQPAVPNGQAATAVPSRATTNPYANASAAAHRDPSPVDRPTSESWRARTTSAGPAAEIARQSPPLSGGAFAASRPEWGAAVHRDLPPRADANHPAGNPPRPGLENYCPVTLVEQEQWVRGDPRWGVVHAGRVYLFAGPDQQQRFLQDFDHYAPVLSGHDPVLYVEQGMLHDGKRAHGIFYRGRVYLFADEQTLQRFWQQPERFAGAALAEQQQPANGHRRR